MKAIKLSNYLLTFESTDNRNVFDEHFDYR